MAHPADPKDPTEEPTGVEQTGARDPEEEAAPEETPLPVLMMPDDFEIFIEPAEAPPQGQEEDRDGAGDMAGGAPDPLDPDLLEGLLYPPDDDRTVPGIGAPGSAQAPPRELRGFPHRVEPGRQDDDREPTEPGRRKLRPGPRLVLAVASGKGGVGKSLLAASLGIYLAQLGKRVVLVDAALGSPSLHTLLGIDEPRLSLHNFLRKDMQHIEEVLAETPFTGLSLIPGHDNGFGAANPRPVQKNRLLAQLRTLPAELVVIDLDAGCGFNVLDFFLAADLHLVVTVPEPTAIESSFRLIKSGFIRQVSSARGMAELLEDLRPSALGGLPTPNQLFRLARERDPGLGDLIHEAMESFKPRLVVNKTRTRDDLELGQAMTVVGRRHLGLPLDYLGYVENDDLAWVTIRKRRPLLVEYPEAKVCKDLERVARRIISLETKERPECMAVPKTLTDQNHYEVLGLHPGATDEDVRRAQRRVRGTYSHGSSAIFGIAPPDEVELMLRRIEAAYATLVDPDRRHLYNQTIFPGGRAPEVGMDAQEDTPSPVLEGTHPHAQIPPLVAPSSLPAIDEETEFTGELLRQVRIARGIDLDDIAERTKITRTYLKAIEEEDFQATPAPVYLRGFIKTVARELQLDPQRVAISYMKRYAEVMGH